LSNFFTFAAVVLAMLSYYRHGVFPGTGFPEIVASIGTLETVEAAKDEGRSLIGVQEGRDVAFFPAPHR
jgi:hypothetical protein